MSIPESPKYWDEVGLPSEELLNSEMVTMPDWVKTGEDFQMSL